MQTVKEIAIVNRKFAQFKELLGGHTLKKEYKVKWIMEKMGDINHRVVASNYLQANHPDWIGCTALHFAVSARALETFEILLNHEADFTVKNSKNLTPLHQIIKEYGSSISSQHTVEDSFVNLVLAAHLKYSVFQNPVNDSGLSHFHIACAANNLEVVNGFVNSGVSVNHTVDSSCTYFPGFSPLHFAAMFSAVEVIGMLLSQGADLHIKNAEGLTPLHVALERKIKIISDIHAEEMVKDKNEQILKLLLDKQKNDSMTAIDEWNLCNLHVSCTLRDSKVAEHFLQSSININSVVSMDSPLWPGYTALHFASVCNIDTVKLLVKGGADMRIKNAEGLTPFNMCIRRYKPQDIHAIISLHPIWKNIALSDGRTKLAELILSLADSTQIEIFLEKLGENSSICFDAPLWPGFSPMHLAVTFVKTHAEADAESVAMSLQVLRIIHEKSPSAIDSQDVRGCTPVHLAFRLSNNFLSLQLLMKFLRKCPNLTDRVDEDGLSYLHVASANNNALLLRRLLTMGINVDTVYRGKSVFPMIHEGSTALHFAVINESAETLKILVEHGADVCAKNANGVTPIHLLLLSDEAPKPTADILLSLPDLEDSVVSGIGLSHLHVASFYNHNEAVERLLERGADVNGVINWRAGAHEERHGFELSKGFAGRSPLSLAYREPCTSAATAILLAKRGADCFVEDAANGVPWLYGLSEERTRGRWDLIVGILRERGDVLARVRADTGMTSLHVACLFGNVEDVKKCLVEGANVDQRIRADSPILRGCTALHLLFCDCELNGAKGESLKLLLSAGADVTLQSASSETAVHMAYDMCITRAGTQYYTYANMLLEAQRDFSVNPAMVNGLSHFHVACSLCNAEVVGKFLKKCVDVDQPIDHFDAKRAGSSALHLAAERKFGGFTRQLYTIDLLLKHGVDVRVEDYFGDTPLQESVRHYNLDVFERLVRGGSDVNARNLYGNTPLDNYLIEDKVSDDGVKLLLRFGCRFNSFNPIDDSGCIGYISNALSYQDMQFLVSALNVNFPQEMDIDNNGRTVIHNLVSTKKSKLSVSEYSDLIVQLSRAGYDVDDQDKSGKTALHTAAKFHNANAVSGLLLAGADIDILDSDSKTAFASIIGSCGQCGCYGDDEEDNGMCKHEKTFQTLAIYVNKLKIFQLDVSKQNEDSAIEFCKEFESQTALSENFFKELEITKTTTIGSCTLTFHDFLSGHRAVAGFPRMLIEKRDAVNNFFAPSKMPACREKFPELAGILLLQYRRASARPQLVESALSALTVCAGYRLPELCSDFILTFLKNTDLKSLIAAAIFTEDAE